MDMIWLMLISLSVTHAVEVMHFQADNSFNNESYAKRIIEEELSTFSICMRFQPHFFRGLINTIFSLSTAEDTDFYLLQFGQPSTVTAEGVVTTLVFSHSGARMTFALNDSVLLKWFHVCIIVGETETGDRFSVTYLDGQEYQRKENADFPPLPSGSCLILAQEQDEVCGGFDVGQGFAGKIAQFRLWPEAVSEDVVRKEASCSHHDVEEEDVDSLSSWTLNQVELEETDKSSFCNDLMSKRYILLPHDLTWVSTKAQCDIFNADMPLFDMESVEQYDLFMTLLSEMDPNNHPTCATATNGRNVGLYLNLGIESRDGLWVNSNTLEPIEDAAETFVNPIGRKWNDDSFACVIVEVIEREYHAADANYCEQMANSCSFCVKERPGFTWVYLKGLPKEFSASLDNVYYLYGLKNDRLYFRGVEKSELAYDNMHVNKFQFWSYIDEENTLEFNTFFNSHPFGRHQFTLYEEDRFFTFSPCTEYEYTCNSGHCIPLSNKCDSIVHCQDGSDEKQCPIINLPESYLKRSPPISTGKNEPAYVNATVSIFSIPSIDTVDMTFTVSYNLYLKWRDNRLEFYDIHPELSLNEVDHEVKHEIWNPHLIMENSLELDEFSIDDDTNVFVSKDSRGKPIFVDGAETMFYKGGQNRVIVKQPFLHTFTCKFELYYYPFDSQHCMMNISSSKLGPHQLAFVVDEEFAKNGVELYADKDMTEYVIKDNYVDTEVNRKGVNQITVHIEFQRRMKFHVTNTFLQTQALIIVGYLSFFFRIDNFTDRIMVTLTVTLVMVTLMSSIQGSLPKTSYYKLIDYWLLYCLLTLIITFVFHTVSGCAFEGKKFCGYFTAGEKLAKRINKWGKIIVMLFMLVVNVTFWCVALKEYVK